MTNEEWTKLLDGLMKISSDPNESENRRRKAFDTLDKLTRGSVGVAALQGRQQGKQTTTAGRYAANEAEYNGWYNNRD